MFENLFFDFLEADYQTTKIVVLLESFLRENFSKEKEEVSVTERKSLSRLYKGSLGLILIFVSWDKERVINTILREIFVVLSCEEIRQKVANTELRTFNFFTDAISHDGIVDTDTIIRI